MHNHKPPRKLEAERLGHGTSIGSLVVVFRRLASPHGDYLCRATLPDEYGVKAGILAGIYTAGVVVAPPYPASPRGDNRLLNEHGVNAGYYLRPTQALFWCMIVFGCSESSSVYRSDSYFTLLHH